MVSQQFFLSARTDSLPFQKLVQTLHIETVENFNANAISETRESIGMRCLYPLFDSLPQACLLSYFLGGVVETVEDFVVDAIGETRASLGSAVVIF